MMMPANYSVVAENEMTYVVGGGIADILAPVMTAQNVQNIVVNTITMVGSYFVNGVIGNGLYAIFGGDGFLTGGDGFGTAVANGFKAGLLGYDWENSPWESVGNLALNVVGMASAIYTMGVKAIGPSFEGNIGKFAPKA